jgi:hypothetical protein
MNETETGLRLLMGELAKARGVLLGIEQRITAFEATKLPPTLPATDDAIILSQYLANFYTCIETALLRVSRHFENHLPPHKWHRAILENLSVEVPGFRPALLSDSTRMALDELRKFRHFTRYYFEFEYDWDKILFLLKKYHTVRSQIHSELEAFEEFIQSLLNEASSSGGRSSA